MPPSRMENWPQWGKSVLKPIIVAFLLVGLALSSLPSNAQGVDAGTTTTFNRATYYTCFPNIVLVISAGCATWWIDSPSLMSTGRTGSATTPTTCMAYTGYNNCYAISVSVAINVAPLVGLTVSAGGTSYAGCHFVGGSAPVGTSVLQTVQRTFFIGVDEGSQLCGGLLQLVLQTIGGSPTSLAHVGGYYEFRVPYQDNLMRFCNASELTTDTAHPDTGSVLYPKRNPCTTPSVNVPDIAAEIDELRDNLCRPTGNHGHCSLDIHGGLDIAQDGPWTVDIPPITISNASINNTSTNNAEALDLDIVFPLLLFLALIIWAEAKREPLLYVLAILAGVIAVVGLSVAFETRSILVAIVIFLAWRLFIVRKEIMEQDA